MGRVAWIVPIALDGPNHKREAGRPGREGDVTTDAVVVRVVQPQTKECK